MITETNPSIDSQLAEMHKILVQIKGLLTAPPETRSNYSVEEVAAMLSKSAFTVREWCRNGRINATKRSGAAVAPSCGASPPWRFPASKTRGFCHLNQGGTPKNDQSSFRKSRFPVG